MGLAKEADMIDQAIAGALSRGLRTADIMQPNMRKVGTAEMGTAILEELGRLTG
jgi:3-isopropylmalate dehydrogenase